MVGRVDVTHILRALEDTESQRSEEVSGCQQTSGRTQCESGVASQEIAHFAQLGKLILTEDSLFLQLGKYATVLGTSVLRHQIDDRVEDGAPGLVLNVGVVNVRNVVTAGEEKNIGRIPLLFEELYSQSKSVSLLFECKRNGGNNLSPLAINLIGESGMGHVQLGLVLGHQVIAVVQLRSVFREPWSLDAEVVLSYQVHSTERVGLTQRTDQQQKIAARHINLDEDVVLYTLFARLARFQVDDDTMV